MNLLLLLLLFLYANCLHANTLQGPSTALKIGSKAPGFSAKLMSNGSLSYTLDCSKHKITILEFWATWCSPCIKEVPRLNALHKRYRFQVQVLGIADDSAERLRQFTSKVPVAYPLIADINRAVAKLYPHQMLPYTIILDSQQRVIAITTPTQLTDQVIECLLQGRPVALSSPEMETSRNVLTQPIAKEITKPTAVFKNRVPGGSSVQAGKGEYQGRRWTYVNMTIDHIYRHTYGFTSSRVLYLTSRQSFDPENSKHLFYFDVIVPELGKASLLQTIRLELDKVQPVRSRLGKTQMPVYVLKRKSTKIGFSKAKGVGKGMIFSGSSFHNQGVTLKDFSYFLENALVDLQPWLPLPVVDETGLADYYNIDFVFQFEDPASLGQALNRLGLILEREERETECLYISNTK